MVCQSKVTPVVKPRIAAASIRLTRFDKGSRAVALAGFRLPQSLVSHKATSPARLYSAKHPLAIFARFLV